MGSVTVDQDDDKDGSGVEVAVGGGAAPVDEAPGDPFLGRSFGGYQLIEKIGHGGMGMVYRGRQVSLNRDVAVKLLNKALVDNDEFIKRFRREAQSMATIHHPNIVSVIDFGESDGIWYMVAEYVEGSNLARWIREKVIVSVPDLVPIIIQCLSGLAYVSRNNIVHRDIKPDNILIDLENTAKIADFGLAKDIANNDTDLTAAGSAMGTPAYMSPEQCMGRNLDVRSDIYSLGVAAYFALTGEKPFTGSSSFEIMTKQREYNPPPPSQLNPQVPEPVSELIMRMIAKKPVDRFPGADDCRDDWIAVATEIGLMGPVTRSGEFLLPVPPAAARPPSAESQARMAAVAYPDVDDQLPPAPVGDLGLPEPPPLPDSNAGDQVPRQVTPVPVPAPHPPGTEPVSRPSTTRAQQQSGRHGRRTESTGEFMTCSRCGHLNQGHRQSCERCDTAFQETAPGQQDVAGMLAETERLLQQGHYADAARRFGKLAEMEQDRRQRSVLRAKEREARNHLEQQTLRETQQRSSFFVSQGNPKAALKLLERAKEGQSTVMVSECLQAQIDEIRRQLSRRRRRRLIIVILALLVAAGVVAHHFFADQIMTLVREWSSPTTEAEGGVTEMVHCPRCGADQEVAASARWAVCSQCGHLWKPGSGDALSAAAGGDEAAPEAMDIRPITVVDPAARRQDSDEVPVAADEVPVAAEVSVSDPLDADPVEPETDADDLPFPMDSSEYHPDEEVALAGLEALTVRRNGRPPPSFPPPPSPSSPSASTAALDDAPAAASPAAKSDADFDLFDRIEHDIAFQRSEHRTVADPTFVPDPAAPGRQLHCPMCGTEVQTPGNAAQVRCPQCDTAIEVATGRVSDGDDDDSGHHSGTDDLLQCTISGCIIDRKLGEGGMGAVYHARQVSLDRSVAIKVLPPDLKRNRKFIRRFEQEAKAMARINHPNIMHIYDFGEDAGTQAYYMVMEYVDGEDLAEVLQRRRHLPPDEVLDIILQCARGLAMSAEKQVVHRDIKPDNLMITRQGVVKISDFGLAKDIAADLEVTNAGMRVGTPAFMSPEQCDGKKLDFRSDIYSLGCTAYVALTGHLPFNGDSPFSIMLKHKSAPYPGLGKYLKEVDPAIDALIEHMMAKEPEDRYASLEALIAEVDGLVAAHRNRSASDSSSSQSGPAWRQPSNPTGDLPPLPFDVAAIQGSQAAPPAPPPPAAPMAVAPEPAAPVVAAPSASGPVAAQRSESSVGAMPSPVPLGDDQRSSGERPSPVPSAHASQGVRSRPLGSGISSRRQVATDRSSSASSSGALPAAAEPDASHTAQLIARGEEAMQRDDYPAAVESYQDAVQRRPGERTLHARLAEARAAARQQEVGQIESEGDRLAHAGKLRAAIAAWQRAAQMHSEWRYRENVLQKVDRAYSVIARRRRRRIVLVVLLVLCSLVGALFFATPMLHRHLAAEAWEVAQAVPEERLEDEVAAFLERYGSVPQWYAVLSPISYDVPAVVAARDRLQEITQQREQAHRRQRQRQAYQRLQAMSEDDTVSWSVLAAEARSVQDNYQWPDEEAATLGQLVADAERQVEALRDGIVRVDNLLAQGQIAEALALASRLRQRGRLGPFGGSLPHPVTIAVVDSQGAALASPTVTIIDEKRSTAVPLEDPELGYRLRDRSLVLMIDVPGFIRLQQTLPSLNDDDSSTITVTMRPGRAWVSSDFSPIGTAPWTRFIRVDEQRALLHGGHGLVLFQPSDGTILAVARRNDYQPEVGGGLDRWAMALQVLDDGWVVAGQDGRVIELSRTVDDRGRLNQRRALAGLRQPVVAAVLFEPLTRLGREYLVSIQQAARHYWMQAVDLESGEVRWRIDEFSAESVPYLLRRRDKLFVIGHHSIRGIDEESGREMPALELAAGRSGQPRWLADGRVVIPLGTYLDLIAFPQQVEMRRDATSELPAALVGSPVTAGDRVAVALTDGSVQVFSAEQQRLRLLLRLDAQEGRRLSGIMAMDARRLAVADTAGRMTVYDHQDDGAVLRVFDHPAPVVAAHLAEDMLLVYDEREQVSAYFSR